MIKKSQLCKNLQDAARALLDKRLQAWKTRLLLKSAGVEIWY
jgi:hypothetical protein